jgi:pimeloyl-ACP methyl ester carboxylesterase
MQQMVVTEGYIETEDEVRLFFRKVGTGSRTILLPNGMHMFDNFVRLADSRTLIFYDVRNRGFSDSVTDGARLSRGIHQDVDDLETVRRHFHLESIDLIGHSYIGLMLALYAMKHPAAVNSMILIGPVQPDAATQYPAHLTGADSVLTDVFSKLAQLQKVRPEDPEEACRQFWLILRSIYVAEPANAEKIRWGRCELPNERNFMKYWTGHISPSIQNIHLTAEELSSVKMPVLIIHGNRDRSAPYGGARDWGLMLPNARLLTVSNAAHAPWIEAPEVVFDAISGFLAGNWPHAAEEVKSLDLPASPAH